MLDIPCVIFAGGKSSRMGEDKSLLPFGTFKTLTQFQLHRLQKIFKKVYISCKNADKFDFEAEFIEDVKTDNIFAPTAGFVAMFEKLQEDRVFVISVDTPFVGKEEIVKILEKDLPHAETTIAQTACGIQPMCGIYHRSLQNKFITMLETNYHKLGFLIKDSKTTYVKFENEEPFLNLNHPHEYKEALKLI
ncbi:MAG: molybdenum cofactor guanylyltransferase [Helicobacteraceae bacterium CG2_30_36_10]|nr:MAG: molybdenum cofactor guanylyltransferase [Helicobacteraceae bacterium CG2_30_36_10]